MSKDAAAPTRKLACLRIADDYQVVMGSEPVPAVVAEEPLFDPTMSRIRC